MAQTKTSRRSTTSRSRSPAKRTNGAGRDEEMYRRAAEDALGQLDWAIGYLHGIRKTSISRALAKNRTYIRTNLMGWNEQPLPDETR